MTRIAWLPVLLSLACLSPLTAHTQAASSAPSAPATLEIGGVNGSRIHLTQAALQALPRQNVRVHNPHTKADETYQGVELAVLLAKVDAPLGPKQHGNALAMYIVAEGSDSYRAVYSLAEIDPAFHTGTVIVADRENGQPIANDGPFKMVNTEDKRPARWVRNLASIQLSAAP